MNELVIGSPVLAYELNERGQDNLNTIAKNAGGSGGDSQAETSASSGPEPRILIRELVFREGQVSASAGERSLSRGSRRGEVLQTRQRRQ